MAGRRDEGLPVAIANQAGLLGALAVLMIGLANGGRAWIVLAQAGGAFLMISAMLKLLTAAVMQGIRMKATPAQKETRDDVEETVRTIVESQDLTPQPTERVAR